MKTVILTKKNKLKYCPICEEVVTIVMSGNIGYCPTCHAKLYTTETKGRF